MHTLGLWLVVMVISYSILEVNCFSNKWNYLRCPKTKRFFESVFAIEQGTLESRIDVGQEKFDKKNKRRAWKICQQE